MDHVDQNSKENRLLAGAEDDRYRHLRNLLILYSFGKKQRFVDLIPHVGADPYQQEAQQERNAPCPGLKLSFSEEGHEPGDRASGKNNSERPRSVNPRGIEAALLWRSIFQGQHNCCRVLAAKRKTLHESEEHQNDGRPDSDGGVGGQQADAGVHPMKKLQMPIISRVIMRTTLRP